MSKVTFYHNPMSRAQMVHWMLEEIGQPYEIKLVRFDKGEHKSPEFLAVNPMGKLPTIIHEGVVVTETAAIITYLADAFPEANLAPAAGDPARGTYLRWLFFGAGCIEPALIDKAFNRPPVDRPGALGYGSYEDTMGTIEKALQPGPWLLGERFTAADVYIGAQLGWGMMFGNVERRPVFEAYVARCQARPANARLAEINAPFMAEIQG